MQLECSENRFSLTCDEWCVDSVIHFAVPRFANPSSLTCTSATLFNTYTHSLSNLLRPGPFVTRARTVFKPRLHQFPLLNRVHTIMASSAADALATPATSSKDDEKVINVDIVSVHAVRR